MKTKVIRGFHAGLLTIPVCTVILFILLSACHSSDPIKGIHNQFARMKTLNPVDSLVLMLDYESIPDLDFMEVLKIDNQSYLFTLVNQFDMIKQYNLDDGSLKYTIDFKTEGINILGLLTYQHVSSDTLICLDTSGNLWLIPYQTPDKEVQKINIYEIAQESNVFFHPSLLPGIRISKSKFLFADYYGDSFDKKILVAMDFEKQSSSLHLQVPREFIEGFFNYKRFAYWNYAYIEDQQLMYFSFPNLDSIYVYGLDFELKEKFELKSKLKIISNISLMTGDDPKMAIKEGVNWHEVDKKARMQFYYEGVVYDQTKNRFYRFSGLPIPEYKIDEKDPVISEIRQYTLLVCHPDFKTIEEYAVPFNRYKMESRSYFVHEGKLYMERKLDTEDMIILDIFDL